MTETTDHLFAEETNLSVRAGLTGFPVLVFPIGGNQNLLFDSMVPNWSDKADIVAVDFKKQSIPPLPNKTTKPILYVLGSIPSSIARGHAISIAIDTKAKAITYRDPYGSPPPQQVTQWLHQEFPSYKLTHTNLKQQRDAISCSWMSLANIVSQLEGGPIDPALQDHLDMFKGRVLHAARTVWEKVTPAAKGNLTDPIGLPCFQHLDPERARAIQSEITSTESPLSFRKKDERKRFNILPSTDSPPSSEKKFIVHRPNGSKKFQIHHDMS
ncbi:MAG: hypothetical protein PHW63_08515 [Alphaproteobacteria bacterium]|nr:hypothetical protein [Alphaproteobacteria bacterium]